MYDKIKSKRDFVTKKCAPNQVLRRALKTFSKVQLEMEVYLVSMRVFIIDYTETPYKETPYFYHKVVF